MKQSFFARYAFTIIVVTVFGMPIVFGAARFALKTNTNDVKQWLPESYAETQEYHRFRRHFEGEEFILVSWDGCTLEDGRLPLLAAKLVPPPDQRLPEDGPPLFKKVITGPGVVETLTSEPTSLSYEQAVERMSGTLIGHDLATTCAVLTLSDAGKVSLHKTIAKIRDTAANECAVPLDSLHMGGPPVDNVAIDVAGQESLYRLAGLAGIIGLVISWWCLRTWRLITMVFATAIYSAAASLAVVYWTGDSLNAILLTMPPLVYVAATSGAIHLSNYYRDTAKELGVEGAPGRALRHALLPISLATITTSVGLLSLCYSELVPIQMFGLFSAIGVGISMLLLTVWMPAALQLFPLPDSALRAADAEGPGTFDPMSSDRWPAIGRWILRRHWLVNAACLLLLGLCTWGVTKVQTSVQLMRLFDSKARILADYKWLEENLGELIPMEVVIKIDEAQSKLTFLEQMELVSRIQHRVDAIDVVGSSLSCVTFAPDIPISEKPKSRRGFREITERNVRNKRLDEHRDDFLAGDYLRQANGSLLWRISARVGALKDVDYHRFIEDIKAQVEPVLAEERDRLKAAGVQNANVVQATYTGLVPLVYKAQRSLLDGLILGFVGDLIVVTLVMMIAVREWSAGLVLSLPSIFPAVIVFGVMGWTGIVVDVGTVMAPAVALGVTVDDVVHFMLWYRDGLKQGLERREAIMLAYKGCARAMYQSWGVIGLGLSVFALSPFQPTQRFGYLMVTLLTAALVGNLLLLPTLLAGPLGLLFGWRLRKNAQKRKLEAGYVPPPHELHAPARADAAHRAGHER